MKNTRNKLSMLAAGALAILWGYVVGTTYNASGDIDYFALAGLGLAAAWLIVEIRSSRKA